LLLRSTEAKPLFSRFVYSLLLNQLFYFSQKIKKIHSSQMQQAPFYIFCLFTFFSVQCSELISAIEILELFHSEMTCMFS